MSPRSEEFLAEAEGRLRAARATLDAGEPPASLSASYYAMLYAARAALSEVDRYSKTHSGTWELFREAFVLPGAFDEKLAREAARAQALRWSADYDAFAVGHSVAARWLETADRFVSGVRELLA